MNTKNILNISNKVLALSFCMNLDNLASLKILKIFNYLNQINLPEPELRPVSNTISSIGKVDSISKINYEL